MASISLGAMVYPEWTPCTLEAQIAALRSCGLGQTEIFMTEKTLAAAHEIAKLLRREGIAPVSLHAPFSREISLSTLDPLRRLASVSKGLAAIEAAGAAGVETVIFHPADDVRNIPLRGEYAEALTESLRKLCAAARERGLRVAIENMPSGELGASIVEIADLVRASGIRNLGVCVDTGHANMNKDLVEGVAAAGDRLFALHVHDNDGVKDQHLAVFAGTADWEGFVGELARVAFRGCFMLETGYIFPREGNPAPSLEWLERLRQLLARHFEVHQGNTCRR
jgi:sugar phosphate isomerase/epimerase